MSSEWTAARTRALAARLALAAFGLALLGLAACGGGGRSAGSAGSSRGSVAGATTRPGASIQPRHAVADFDGDDYEAGGDADDDDSSPPYDRDGDSDGEPGHGFDQDDAGTLGPAGPPMPHEKSAVQAFIRRYFAALAAGDGRAACSLMLARVASRIPGILGEKDPRPRFVHGSSCSAITDSELAFYGRQLRAEAASVRVVAVHAHGASSLAVLGFGPHSGLPLRVISLARESGRWRVDGMFDNELP